MMVLLTFIIGVLTVKVRFASVRNREVNPKFYKLMQGQEVPEIVTKTTRCFNNMFETPVLFYVVCSLYFASDIESVVGIIFAWLFVALRYIHAYIHLTYNHVVHRLIAFGCAFLCIMVLWGNLIVQNI
jgi:hypothetical protein